MAANYEKMVAAIAEYLGDMEVICEEEPNEKDAEPIDLLNLNGQYILDRLEAETDAMDEIALKVKARIEASRNK